MSVEVIIKQRIREQGSISIAEYMELALSHPEYGYYIRRDPFGVQGDFTTAPEISQIFGEMIGLWLAEQWRIMASPPAIALVELGPGRGTLMHDILRATKHIAGFHEAISIHLVEMSPTLKEKQWKTLAGKHDRLNWHDDISTLPEEPLLLVANEFFDALPIRQYHEGQERCITLDKLDNLIFTLPDTDLVERCESAIAISTQIGQHIRTHGGTALIIDYGYIGGSRGDTLQALKKHQYHDVLKEPGNADITAHVDFDALKQAISTTGATAHGAVPQGAWLMRLGAGTRLQMLCQHATEEQGADMIAGFKRLAAPDQMGDLFKILCITHPDHLKPEGF